MPDRGLIVVGFSTMRSSQAAVEWAAAEAERRGSELRIVHSYPLPQVGQPVQHDVDDLLRAEASALLDHIADSTARSHPDVEISTRLIQGAPVNALLDESSAAALVVVGARETGRFARSLLGSVASAIAAVDPAPVVVVHPDHAVDGSGPIIVGVDGSAGNAAAIDFAFGQAAARKKELVAVHAWHSSALKGGVPDYPAILAQTAGEQEAIAVLSAALADWGAKFPDVVVTHAVRRGPAATELVEFSKSASLVVVGRRPRGEFEAMVLGSTSRSLTAHSQCPVVIVHFSDNRS